MSIIETRVDQTNFFLNKVQTSTRNFFEIQCYCDAFASSCRSITFSIQAVCGKIDGFEEWYKNEQIKLSQNKLSVFFNKYRVYCTHIGDTPIKAATWNRQGECNYFFLPCPDLPEVPSESVIVLCVRHFTTILDLTYRLFEDFKYDLDDRWHYTKEYYDSIGLTIDDALVSLGFPKGWLGSLVEDDVAWATLRRSQTFGPQIQTLFSEYLGKTIKGPDDELTT